MSGPDLSALYVEPLDNGMAWAAEQTRRYVETDGEGHDRSPDGAPVLLLTTIGRKSGAARRNPVVFGRAGDSYVLAASKGGADAHPAWYLNLVAQPEVLVQVRGNRMRATARVAHGAEREELFARMLEVLEPLATYVTQTSREIPIVVVTPHDRPDG